MAGKKKGNSAGGHILLIFGLLTAIVFLPTTILLLVGMLPTLVSVFIDRTAEKTRGLTVGAMNLAGCMPFMLQLWTGNNNINQALLVVTDPRTIVVMYCAAGVGYVLDWAVSGLVASFMVQAGTARARQITRRQEKLIERWGREVTGEIPTDHNGFPLEQEQATTPEKPPATPQ